MMIGRTLFRMLSGGFIVFLLLWVCVVMLLSSCKKSDDGPKYQNAKEALAKLESMYSGNFEIIESGTLRDGTVSATELGRRGIPQHFTRHTVTVDKYPGLEFHVYGNDSRFSDWYQYELYRYQAAEYMETDSNFAFENGSHMTSYNCISYYYDGYSDIEAAHDAVEDYIEYMIDNHPFDEFSWKDDYQMAVFVVLRDDKVFSNFRNSVFFNHLGSAHSREKNLEDSRSAYRSYCVRYEYGYEYLSEAEQADHWEQLAEKVEEEQENQEIGYSDFPIRTAKAAYYNEENTVYRDTYGLSVGSFYTLCVRLGLEVSGDSRAFEVVGANGSRYRFNYYFCDNYEDYKAMKEKEYAECVYYKDGEAIPMGDDEAVRFSVIEEVIGRTLVDSSG